jgi:cellulose synthase/poly-beta-1,6-N-acetylglucosamine synthase-like glycosyltransferase
MILSNFLLPYGLRLAVRLGRGGAANPCRIEKVSVIIPVFNEEKYILARMANVKEALAHIERPHEVLIGSDGSTDNTVGVVEGFIREHQLRDWRVLSFSNEGKGRTINKLVGQSRGDLIVSTDADVSMDAKAVDLIIRTFEGDERVGCMSSVPTFFYEEKSSQSFYWNLEMKVRDAESRMGKLIVVTGWLYAFRKGLFSEIPSSAMADDLWVPLTVLIRGSKCVHHQRLKAFSEKTDEATEVSRRGRVISGGVDIVRRLFPELLKKPGLFWTVFFHKINRWLLPFWCLLIVLVSVSVSPYFLLVYLGLFALLAVYLTPRRLFYLVRSVISPVLSLFSMARKKDLSKWEHTRVKG